MTRFMHAATLVILALLFIFAGMKLRISWIWIAIAIISLYIPAKEWSDGRAAQLKLEEESGKKSRKRRG